MKILLKHWTVTLDSEGDSAEAENWIETENLRARKARKTVMDIHKRMAQAIPNQLL